MKIYTFFQIVTLSIAAFWVSPARAAPAARLADGPTVEMTEDWWRWAMMQGQGGPVGDTTGALCAMGQQGDVWFLAGGFGSTRVQRSCDVPAGRKLFFPLVNMVYYAPARGRGLNCDQARRAAAVNNDMAIELFAELDGAPFDSSAFHRLRSRSCFDVFARVPPQLGFYNAYPSASDGFWIMLQPLAPGEHVLKFGGRYNQSASAYGRMIQDIEYRLTVR